MPYMKSLEIPKSKGQVKHVRILPTKYDHR